MTTKTTYAFLAVTVFVALSLVVPSMVSSAFADHTATQPNANVSYNSLTNEVQVDWDFTTGPNAPTTCLLKGDMWFFTDLDNAFNTDQSNSDDPNHQYYNHLTRITGFVPTHYSVVSSTPTTFQTISEVIPCQGSTRIDIDIVMSDPSNVKLDGVTPREDLQIFLSFYSQHENKNFTFDIIDEVFVFYTPNVTWSTAAKDYACGGQIGNTIYIDKSAKGIHTNNGDNCNKYLELESNEWIDIDSSGNETPGTHVARAYSLLIKIYEGIISTGGGSGCGSDCTAPWLGKDKDGVLQVEGGITINGVQKNGGLYYTEYPMIYTNINDENTVTLIYQENQGPTNIKLVQLASVKEVGTSLGESQWMIEVWLNDFRSDVSNPTIKEIIIEDDYNLLVNVNATVSLVQCKADSVDQEGCLSTTFTFTNIQIPYYPVLVAEAIDYKNNSFQNFFNDGLQVVDPYYVEPTPPEPYKYECKDSIQKVMTRNNCNFNDIIQSEANRALALLTH